MAKKTDWARLLKEVPEERANGFSQEQVGKILGVNQGRVSLVERILRDGQPVFKDALVAGKLPADAAKYVPRMDPEGQIAWTESYLDTNDNQERQRLMRMLKVKVQEVDPPKEREIRAFVWETCKDLGGRNPDYLLGLASGIGYALGYLNNEQALDEEGQAQVAVCKNLACTRKGGTYIWLRNAFSQLAREQADGG